MTKDPQKRKKLLLKLSNSAARHQIPANHKEIKECIKNFHPRKASGHDKITNDMPTKNITLSFPKRWNHAFVTMIP